jgi:hypothetical protein
MQEWFNFIFIIENSIIITINGLFKLSKLTALFTLINGHVPLTKGLWFEWHISEFGWKIWLDHLSNWTSSQLEQNIDNLSQNGQRVLIKWDI